MQERDPDVPRRLRPRPKRAFAALAALFALLAGCPARPAPAERPNVIVILIDTLRADRLGAYGYPRPTSPFLDQLAREGALFADATAQASWTLPSMVSMHTGRYVTAYRDSIPEGPATLAETFRRAGYATIGVVANQGMRQEGGFHRGFQWFDNRPARDAEGRPLHKPRSIEEAALDLAGHLDHAASLAAGERVPLFVYLHAMDAHFPYDAYPELADEVPERSATEPMPWGWQRDAFRDKGLAPPADDPAWAARWRAIERDRGRYDQGVRHTDDGLRRLFDELRERGLLAHAVVAVVSDHGEFLWERPRPFGKPEKATESAPDEFFYSGHGALMHGEGIDTPFLLWGAGIPAGKLVTTPVENVDLYPTLLELCDLPLVEGLHGRSVVPLFTRDEPDREAVYSFSHNACAVREVATGLKLILPNEWRAHAEIEPQLYDLARDPDERDNLIDARPADTRRLMGLFARWRDGHPTESTFDTGLDAEVAARLRELGYTEEDIGR